MAPPVLPVVPVEEFRRRIDADPVAYPDADLEKRLAASSALVAAELDPDTDYSLAENVAEAVLQLAIKVWDLGPRGAVDLDLSGDMGAPMSATRGLVLSVRGLLLPSMGAGGVTV